MLLSGFCGSKGSSQTKKLNFFPKLNITFIKKIMDADLEDDMDLKSKWQLKSLPSSFDSSDLVSKLYFNQNLTGALEHTTIFGNNKNNTFYANTSTNIYSI